MLSPELKKLKEKLEGKNVKLNNAKLLDELEKLENADLMSLYESLSLSSKVCKCCGRPF